MPNNRIKLIIAALFFHSIGSFAQFRKYSNEFLNIGAGARAMAMGNATITSVSDATAGYWNPANLIFVKEDPTISIMHADYFAGIAKYDYAALAVPFRNNKSVLGFSLLRFAIDDIPNTLFLVESDGSLNYDNIQSFSCADYAFLFSYAHEKKTIKGNQISFGSNAKIINRKVGSFAKAWGFGLDAALSVQGKKWKMSVVAKDVTTTFNAWSFSFTEREKEILYLTRNDIPVRSVELTAPRLLIGGSVVYSLSKHLELVPEVSLEATFDGKRNSIVKSNLINIDPHVGVELGVKKSVYLRGGITNFQQTLADSDSFNIKKIWIYQPSIGLGLKLKNVAIDYAFTNLANQESPLYTNVFSLKLNLIKRKK